VGYYPKNEVCAKCVKSGHVATSIAIVSLIAATVFFLAVLAYLGWWRPGRLLPAFVHRFIVWFTNLGQVIYF
jgi:hypothetical protein